MFNFVWKIKIFLNRSFEKWFSMLSVTLKDKNKAIRHMKWRWTRRKEPLLGTPMNGLLSTLKVVFLLSIIPHTPPLCSTFLSPIVIFPFVFTVPSPTSRSPLAKLTCVAKWRDRRSWDPPKERYDLPNIHTKPNHRHVPLYPPHTCWCWPPVNDSY